MGKSNKRQRLLLSALISSALAASSAPLLADDEAKITFIHSGDFHGDYHPHTNGRGDAAGSLEGGIARGATVIKRIRRHNENVIHVHTGDTIHGSGEASITKGMAMIRLVDQLGIDVSTPGNWEFAYTPYRYMQFFGVHNDAGANRDIIDNASYNFSAKKAVKYTADEIGDVPSFGAPFREVKYVASYNADGTPNMATGYNRWGMVASNVYENGSWALDHGVVSRGTGMNLTPPYRIIERDGIKIGFIGCTTNRGPQVVSSTITTGVSYSNCKGGIKFPQNRPIDWDDQAISHGPWIVDDTHPKGGYWRPGNKVTGNPADASVQAGNRVVSADPWTKRPQNDGTAGYKVKNEIVKWTNHLRNVEGVDLVAVMSEAGIAENIFAAENLKGMDNGPDIYFSSDMHEETNFPVVVTDPRGKKVIIIENSEDIAQISQLDVEVENGRIVEWEFTGHDVNESVRPDRRLRHMAAQIDEEIADSIAAGTAVNPYNGHVITAQLTDVVGQTDGIVLERNRFTTEFDPANNVMPAVIEGTGHDLVTDMFRKMTGADVGGIRGFRYTNSVLDGDDITYKSLYHFFPIGAQVAVGSIPTTPTAETGGSFLSPSDPNKFSNAGNVNPAQFVAFPRSLQQEMELAGNSTMNPNVPAWGGGWFWNYSGVKFDFQPTGGNFDKWGTKPNARVSNLVLYDNADPSKNGPIDESKGATIKYASYYYHEDYNRINRNQLVPGGKCGPTKKLTPACVNAKGDILILAKETATGDYVLVDNLEYDAGVNQHNSTGDGSLTVLDAVEALGRYISDASIDVYVWNGGAKVAAAHSPVAGLGGTFSGLEFPRVNLVKMDGTDGNDLTDCSIEFGSPCIQPFRGAEAAFGVTVPIPAGYIKGTADAPALEAEYDN
ncbi:MAG: hypothetical protein OEZ68_03660 [Gammaproteobacteria bacterium]|nr:hypothetical protein [Gammaproteobacteria bacterium]MDH5799881.1 hypothetical protein [Gammaproteobacteria bacterium]